MRAITWLLAVSVLLTFAQQAPAGLRGAPSTPPASQRLPMPDAGPAWQGVLDDLRLQFFDPETARTFTASGPFEVLESSSDRLVVLGSSSDEGSPPRLTIVATDEGLWVVARFETREFATRLR